MADIQYKPADFKSDQEVRWCPVCGDHAILNSILKAMANGLSQRESSRCIGYRLLVKIPYYVSTYGFHGIHGRASAIASGLKQLIQTYVYGK